MSGDFDPKKLINADADRYNLGRGIIKGGQDGTATFGITVLATVLLDYAREFHFYVPASVTVGVLAGLLAWAMSLARNYLKFSGRWPGWLS